MTLENLKVKSIEFSVRYKAPQREFVSRNKTSHIIGLKLSGDAEHRFADKSFNLKAGDVYFLNREEDYDVRETEPGIAFSVHFTTYEPVKTPSFSVPSGNSDEFMRLLVKIEKSIASRSDENRLMSEFYAFCSAVVKLVKKSYSPKDKRMEEVKEFINLHFREKSCLDDAAELCGLTRRRFNDVFSGHFGITPNRYLVGIKIHLACNLLKNVNISVTDVAQMCGFSDVYYFSRVFRQEVGVSPGKYRREL